jgi:hypothetical protein
MSICENPKKKPQVPPLRYAPVGMTILFEGKWLTRVGEVETSTLQKNCHPDRSVAQWRDLRFLFGFSHI